MRNYEIDDKTMLKGFIQVNGAYCSENLSFKEITALGDEAVGISEPSYTTDAIIARIPALRSWKGYISQMRIGESKDIALTDCGVRVTKKTKHLCVYEWIQLQFNYNEEYEEVREEQLLYN